MLFGLIFRWITISIFCAINFSNASHLQVLLKTEIWETRATCYLYIHMPIINNFDYLYFNDSLFNFIIYIIISLIMNASCGIERIQKITFIKKSGYDWDVILTCYRLRKETTWMSNIVINVVINTAVDWLGVYGFRMTNGFFSLSTPIVLCFRQ